MTEKTNTPSAVALVQNPALGALLLWRFGKAYQEEKIAEQAQLPFHFLVLPLLFHASTLNLIKSTNLSSGLPQLAKKLGDQRELLFSIHSRALSMRELTLDSIAMGVATKLIHIDYETACLRSNEVRAPADPQRLKHHAKGADKLGHWFARLAPDQIFSLLKVEP